MTDIQGHLNSLARTIPPVLADISAQARAFVDGRRGHGTGVIGKAGQEEMVEIQDRYFAAATALSADPGIARVVTTRTDKDGPITYYFCRAIVPGSIAPIDGQLVAYHSPLGQLAELEAGAGVDIRTPRGEMEFEIVERARFTSRKGNDGWDAIDVKATVVGGRESVPSLVAFLAKRGQAADLLSSLLGEVDADNAAQELELQLLQSRRRRAIDSMALRDQPLLDSYQGAVFRLPLRNHLMLFGPPGTGKTTTLIHRCSQKRVWEHLNEDEQNDLEVADLKALHTRKRSWVMFSPSQLLSEYLKEAFAREQVPALQDNLRIWMERRTELGRDDLHIFKGQTGGRFTPFDGNFLRDGSSASQRELFDDFSQFANDSMVSQSAVLARAVLDEIDRIDAHLRDKLTRVLEEAVGDDWWRPLIRDAAALAEAYSAANKAFNQDVRDTLGALLRSDPDLLTDVQAGWSSLRADEENSKVEIDDEDEDEDEEPDAAQLVPNATLLTQAQAVQMLIEGIRLRSRIASGNATVPKKGTMARLLGQFGERLGPLAGLKPLGLRAQFVRRLGRLRRAPRNPVFGLRALYSRFRKTRAAAGVHYLPEVAEGANARRITGPEVDVLVLAMLQAVRRLIARLGRQDIPEWLEPFERMYHLQVFVDEATDFSAVQLACMAELTHPRLQSFFACGDFQQRITQQGIRDQSDLDWLGRTLGATLGVQQINIGYRQNPSLSRLAKLLAPDAVIGSEHDEAVSHDSGPILFENADDSALGPWMLERVHEIKRALAKLPSIAVFVDGDERIGPVVAALKAHFDDEAIPVVGCPGGKNVGRNQEVRVFDVRHVKGLEFEAVFLLDVDRLAAQSADLASRFLFVGMTRAASYLAVATSGKLPQNLEHLRPAFTRESWV